MSRDGIKRFLRRTKTINEIKDLSAQAHAAILEGKDVVVVTSSSFDGVSTSGHVTMSALMLGEVCEEIIAEEEGDPSPRVAMRMVRFT